MRNFLALIFKKLSYFLKRNLFLYFRKWNPALFIPSLKIKKKTPRETFLYFRKTETLKISREVTLQSRKIKIITLKKLLLFQEMENISCTLVLLLSLFPEGELFQNKCKIKFLSLPQLLLFVEAILNLDFKNSSLFFFYFEWLLMLLEPIITNQAWIVTS